MRQILNIITGLIFIISDIIAGVYNVAKGLIKLFFIGNRKNNAFVALFAKNAG